MLDNDFLIGQMFEFLINANIHFILSGHQTTMNCLVKMECMITDREIWLPNPLKFRLSSKVTKCEGFPKGIPELTPVAGVYEVLPPRELWTFQSPVRAETMYQTILENLTRSMVSKLWFMKYIRYSREYCTNLVSAIRFVDDIGHYVKT
jgi:hypothetical protein